MATKRRRMKHRQISVRLAASVFEALERRAGELAASRNALVERYIAEGLRMEEHPDIYFRDGALGRRPAMLGTRLDVWQVIETIRHSGNAVETAAQYLGLPVPKVRAAVRYYAAYRDEVDAFAARAAAMARRAEDGWRAERAVLSG